MSLHLPSVLVPSPLDPDLEDQLRRVLSSLELLLPKPVPPVDWARTHAANWKRHSTQPGARS